MRGKEWHRQSQANHSTGSERHGNAMEKHSIVEELKREDWRGNGIELDRKGTVLCCSGNELICLAQELNGNVMDMHGIVG